MSKSSHSRIQPQISHWSWQVFGTSPCQSFKKGRFLYEYSSHSALPRLIRETWLCQNKTSLLLIFPTAIRPTIKKNRSSWGLFSSAINHSTTLAGGYYGTMVSRRKATSDAGTFHSGPIHPCLARAENSRISSWVLKLLLGCCIRIRIHNFPAVLSGHLQFGCHLIDHNYRFESQLQSFLQHEAGLRHRTFSAQRSATLLQPYSGPLNLAHRIGMPGMSIILIFTFFVSYRDIFERIVMPLSFQLITVKISSPRFWLVAESFTWYKICPQELFSRDLHVQFTGYSDFFHMLTHPGCKSRKDWTVYVKVCLFCELRQDIITKKGPSHWTWGAYSGNL